MISKYTWVNKDVSDNTPVENVVFVDLDATVLGFAAPGFPDEVDYEAECFAAPEEETTDDLTIDEEMAALAAAA